MQLCVGTAEDAVSSATLSVNTLPHVQKNENASVLVVYFSTDDTIRAAALIAADALGADVFEIVPANPYTADDLNYNKTGTRATVEQRDNSARPEIAILPESLEPYSTILLGYPIWWGQAPKIVYTFLESVDVSGKTIIPFCTSASSGVGSSDTNLHALADDMVNWLPAKRISNRETAEGIRTWALSLDLPVKEESHLLYIKIGDVTLTATVQQKCCHDAARLNAWNSHCCQRRIHQSRLKHFAKPRHHNIIWYENPSFFKALIIRIPRSSLAQTESTGSPDIQLI